MKRDSLRRMDGAIAMTCNAVLGYVAGPVLTGGAHMTNRESIFIQANIFTVRTLPHGMPLWPVVSSNPQPEGTSLCLIGLD